MEIQKVTFVATPLLIFFAHPGVEDTCRIQTSLANSPLEVFISYFVQRLIIC